MNRDKKCVNDYFKVNNPELSSMKLFFVINAFLLITDYIMPQYFGIHIGYDITCTRLANMVLVLYMLLNPKILTHFFKTSINCIVVWPLIIYVFVGLYTMIYRTDLNSFFLVFLEVLTFCMLIYAIRYVIGCRRAVKWSIRCAYFFGVYGMIEYACGQSLFLRFLATVPTPVTNTYRSGHYRIMGPCGHPLGYGLLLLLLIALACIDLEKDEIFLFKRPVLLFLLLINIFLTGSRSTLGIAGLELLLILIFSNRRNIKKSLLSILLAIIVLALFLLLFYRTSIGQYILMQITSVIDQVFGTEWAINFGADVSTLNNSEEYRKYLPLIFTLDWLNPIIGRGASATFGAQFGDVYVHSIDNYYVSQYIKFAYPGLVSYCLFILMAIGMMIYVSIKYKSGICRLILIATFCYFVNLWWVDSLQTTKYMYIVVAIFYSYYLIIRDEEKHTE